MAWPSDRGLFWRHSAHSCPTGACCPQAQWRRKTIPGAGKEAASLYVCELTFILFRTPPSQSLPPYRTLNLLCGIGPATLFGALFRHTAHLPAPVRCRVKIASSSGWACSYEQTLAGGAKTAGERVSVLGLYRSVMMRRTALLVESSRTMPPFNGRGDPGNVLIPPLALSACLCLMGSFSSLIPHQCPSTAERNTRSQLFGFSVPEPWAPAGSLAVGAN